MTIFCFGLEKQTFYNGKDILTTSMKAVFMFYFKLLFDPVITIKIKKSILKG